ncbi:probable ATP-dependent RNA helicase DDX28 [Xenopus laevis]|uniref:RNA helicase n=2 Tax=Xenopus laevis TaxID=8355 RepID=A0A974D4N2_XENLA|nr:probable ATP-dependent RNA helicase DDX28 [Xenopus laevis]OCT84261.1 hypothetical protein XELAEV_18022411mg [Xenopus laevis]
MLHTGNSVVRPAFWWYFITRRYCANLPVIRLPCRAQLQFDNLRKQPLAPSVLPSRTGKLLILSRRKELNQYAAETIGRWENVPLVSHGWKKNASCGDHFTILQQQQQHGARTDTSYNFQSLGLSEELVSLLDAIGITSPTWVQMKLIRNLLQGNNILCTAETGSGKTLGYLLPILHGLRSSKLSASLSQPRSLVLVPSRELAAQIVSVAQNFCAKLKLNIQFVGGGVGQALVETKLSRTPIDILVATPGALWKALQKDLINLTSLCYVVLDEADTLTDSTFSKLAGDILKNIKIASSPSDIQGSEKMAQLAVIGATFPSGIGQVLGKITGLGIITTIKSSKLHFPQLHVQQTFLRVKGAEKVSELLTLLKEQQVRNPGTAVFVFCNNSSTVNWLSYILEEHGIKHYRLHGQMPARMRMDIYKSFQNGQNEVLVCTDIASRGLDISRVKAVVNYDFPFTLQDYLHRVGRVGRVGSGGPWTAVSFVTHAWDVELVQKIETAVRKHIMLPCITKKDLLQKNL